MWLKKSSHLASQVAGTTDTQFLAKTPKPMLSLSQWLGGHQTVQPSQRTAGGRPWFRKPHLSETVSTRQVGARVWEKHLRRTPKSRRREQKKREVSKTWGDEKIWGLISEKSCWNWEACYCFHLEGDIELDSVQTIYWEQGRKCLAKAARVCVSFPSPDLVSFTHWSSLAVRATWAALGLQLEFTLQEAGKCFGGWKLRKKLISLHFWC